MQSYQNGDAVAASDLATPTVTLSRREAYLNITASLILGGSAGIPYASPAFKAAGGIPVLGALFGGSTIIAFGGAATWGWHTLIEDLLRKYHTRQIHINSHSIKHTAAACALATCSGMLNMFIVHKYNNKSLLYPLITFMNWYGWDASGFYKLISYFTHVGNHTQIENISESDYEKLLKKLIMVFPVGNFIVNSYLSLQAGEEVVGRNLLAIPFIALALSQFSLEVFSAYELVEEGFAQQTDAAVLSRCEALAKLLFKVMALTTMLFATSSDVFIAKDNFGENIAGYALCALAVGSSMILGQYVLSDLANQGLMLFSRRPPVSTATVEVVDEIEAGENTALLPRENRPTVVTKRY